MFRIAVCDNDTEDLNRLCEWLREYFESCDETEGGFWALTSPDELLSMTKNQIFDVYLLDIIMPGINGIELARKIRSLDNGGQIIFITSSREYAFEAFGIRAQQYLEKPIDKQSLFSELDIARQTLILKKEHSQVNVVTREGVTVLYIDEIMYIENVDRSSVYVLTGGARIEGVSNRVPFENSVSGLEKHFDFIQPHKSYFVNMCHVRMLRPDDFVLDNGKEIPISRKRFSNTKKAYLKFLAQRGA